MSRLIELRGLRKHFGEQRVLDGIDLEVQAGTVHFILGRSGVGKSVLLKHIVGLLEPTQGDVRYAGSSVLSLDDEGLRGLRRRCQLIFQHPTLFEQLTVLENVAMPIRKRFRVGHEEAHRRAKEALSVVEVDPLAERLPAELGRGLQKRVSVARALALAPETLLYDEPTTSLDPVAARRLDRTIRRMADDAGITSLIVSHDLASVEAIADRVTFLEGGRVVFDGSLTNWRDSAEPTLVRFKANGERWAPPTGGSA